MWLHMLHLFRRFLFVGMYLTLSNSGNKDWLNKHCMCMCLHVIIINYVSMVLYYIPFSHCFHC